MTATMKTFMYNIYYYLLLLNYIVKSKPKIRFNLFLKHITKFLLLQLLHFSVLIFTNSVIEQNKGFALTGYDCYSY